MVFRTRHLVKLRLEQRRGGKVLVRRSLVYKQSGKYLANLGPAINTTTQPLQ